jgi:P4 family phage/plasmid primase-like protien
LTECKELFYDAEFINKLDQNEYLMCFNNGVFDFKADVFRSGYPEDYISKTTNIDYIPNDPVKHATVVAEINKFMSEIMPNPKLREYTWDHLASILIGVAKNQTFNMYIGLGQNGKSVMVNLMEKVLGKYKGELPLSYITRKRADGGKASPEMALLKGVRYAVMQEPSKGDRINEGIMKELTSGVDPIQCRGLYSAPITFLPQFKLAVCSNEYMEITSNDFGTWRRIRVLGFESLFTDNPVQGDAEKPHQFLIDRNLPEKFEEWKVPFMAMLVARARITKGFVQDCPEVMAASNTYREKQDYLAEFVRDRIAVSKAGECVQKSMLGQVFGEWYKVNYGNKRADPKEIYAYMDKMYGRLRNGMWMGVKIKYDMDASELQDDEILGEDDIDIDDM